MQQKHIHCPNLEYNNKVFISNVFKRTLNKTLKSNIKIMLNLLTELLRCNLTRTSEDKSNIGQQWLVAGILRCRLIGYIYI